MQQIACLLHCTALYFLRQVFANCWSSLGLQLSLMIQNQSNYQHSRCTYILSAMFTGTSEKVSLALVLCLNVLCMIVKLNYNTFMLALLTCHYLTWFSIYYRFRFCLKRHSSIPTTKAMQYFVLTNPWKEDLVGLQLTWNQFN